MFKAWEEASGGLLKIQEYPVGAIVIPPGLPDAVSSGALDAAYALEIWGQKLPAGVGDVQIGLPYSWTGKDMYDIYYNTDYHKVIEDMWAKFDCVALGPNPSGQICFQAKFPINKIEDMSKKTFYVLGGAEDIVAAGGGVPIQTTDDLYLALKLGTIDGIVYSIPELTALKYGELIKYVVMPSIKVGGGSYIINKKSWNALPLTSKTRSGILSKMPLCQFGTKC